MANLAQVAKEAGVSVTAASMVLNLSKGHEQISEATAKRVRDIGERMGYVAHYHARSIKRGKSDVIGVVIEEPDNPAGRENPLSQAYYGAVLGGVDEKAVVAGRPLMMMGPVNGQCALVRGVAAVRQRQLDGALAIGGGMDPVTRRIILEAPEIPLVVVDFGGPTQLPVVGCDDVDGLNQAVTHLASLGHRDLLWLGPLIDDAPGATISREHQFMTSVWNHGLRGASCRLDELKRGGQREEEVIIDRAAEALSRYIAEGHGVFTAVVCFSDLVAVGAYRALQAAGLRIPADVSVVGQNNLLASYLLPRLTSVDRMLFQMGWRAAEVLLDIVDHPGEAAKYRKYRELLKPQLVIRESTGPAVYSRAKAG